MDKNVDIEQIHRFLSGELTPAERASFERAMEKDEALKKAVRFEQQLLGALEQSFDERTRKDIGQVHRQLQHQGFFDVSRTSTRRSLILRIGSAAAAVFVLCFGLWWFTSTQQPPDPVFTFNEYFQPENTAIEAIIDGLTSIGFTPELNRTDSLRMALQRYQDKDYKDAADALENVLQNHPQNDTARFYLALAEMSLSQYESAATKLSGLSQTKEFGQQKEAQWYLALCYLQLEGRLEQARQLFNNLAEDATADKQTEARAVMEKLKY